MSFRDRADAGRRLAARLDGLAGEDVVVLALPRGGVPVAEQVAEALGAPLDVIVVRKLGLPFRPELAMGAVGEGGVRVVDGDLVHRAMISRHELDAVEARELAELERRTRLFRGDRARVPLAGRTAVVVDDGVATGATARVACRVARRQGAARVVYAVPVGPPDTVADLRSEADEVVCLETHRRFRAVGRFYEDFTQVPDGQVVAILARRAAGRPAPGPGGDRPPAPPAEPEEIVVDAGGRPLAGRLTVPPGVLGVVVIAHGGSGSRLSPRNRFVASVLNRVGLATLLVDLLADHEDRDQASVFDVDVLAGRLAQVVAWLGTQPATRGLPVGLFGTSTGAAAALAVAAEPGCGVAAVVARGGRPDLVEGRLAEIVAPTLLVVGARDAAVVELNRRAQHQIGGETRLLEVPGAGHLFEEPGALPAVADAAGAWFLAHLRPAHPAAAAVPARPER
ncbi:MAG TPA: phosphoribosyltransferase [Acidimicrobiales bacterium]|nr:phosphoribosyltransferase [Acidimicrobiales bacterium]